MMKKIEFVAIFLLPVVQVLGNNSINLDNLFEKAYRYDLPFAQKKLKEDRLPIDSFYMKYFFDEDEIVREFYYFDDNSNFIDEEGIARFWIDGSWQCENYQCFALSSHVDIPSPPFDDVTFYIFIKSYNGNITDKLVIHQIDEKVTTFNAYVVVNEKTIVTLCYDVNRSNIKTKEERKRGESIFKDENAPRSIVHITQYTISKEGKFVVTEKNDVPAKEGSFDYQRENIADDPIYEYLK